MGSVDQLHLFSDDEGGSVTAASPSPRVLDLAGRLRARWGSRWHLGTSSWHFPGWAGMVWQQPFPQARLSSEGLAAYSSHPLLNCVSLDRAFYRPLDAATYARLGQQVGDDFRFVVKGWSGFTDPVQRDPATGAALAPNPLFLDPETALQSTVLPALQGLEGRLGAVVLQLSPLPSRWLAGHALHQRLADMFAVLQAALAGRALLALECRDPVLLTPALASLLKAHGVRYCLGLHDRMPAVEEQLPMLRATWPGDGVCRWNLQSGQRYAQARDRWAPFDRMQAPDPATRQALARMLAATLDAGHSSFVTINNKAEGCAPASVVELAQAMLDCAEGPSGT